MNKALLVYIALAALTLGVFAIWPELDLAGARYFYHGGGFFGRDSFERFGRDFFRVTPFVVLAAYAALWLANGLGRRRLRWAPSGRALIFLIATMIDWTGAHRQSRPQGPLASSPPGPDPGLQRAKPLHALV